MENNYLFKQSEKVGRQLVIDCINNNNINLKDVTPTEGDYDKWDLEAKAYSEIKNKTYNFNIECKNRKCQSYKYPDITINWEKFISNVKMANDLDRISLLAATYTDNTCRFWNLTDLYKKGKYKREMKWMPKTTAEDRGYAWIEIVHLNNNDAMNEYAIYSKTKKETKK